MGNNEVKFDKNKIETELKRVAQVRAMALTLEDNPGRRAVLNGLDSEILWLRVQKILCATVDDIGDTERIFIRKGIYPSSFYFERNDIEDPFTGNIRLYVPVDILKARDGWKYVYDKFYNEYKKTPHLSESARTGGTMVFSESQAAFGISELLRLCEKYRDIAQHNYFVEEIARARENVEYADKRLKETENIAKSQGVKL